MLRASIIIPAYNEGAFLARTVASTVACIDHLDDWEIVVADDASTDGSVDEARRVWPDLRVARFDERQGCPATKDLGARAAGGRIFVFLDGHCKPEPCSLERLFEDIDELGGTAVVTPRIPALDPETWTNGMDFVGHGFRFDLEEMACDWVPLGSLTPRGRFFETPAAVGCCLAMSRDLYDAAGGFDRDMIEWGAEDNDFSLKVWLLGYSILHDPAPVIGHRFRSSFDNYTVAPETVIANQMRMGRKNFADSTWEEWQERARGRIDTETWERSRRIYLERAASAEREGEDLRGRRKRDEVWYAERFGLDWPKKA